MASGSISVEAGPLDICVWHLCAKSASGYSVSGNFSECAEGVETQVEEVPPRGGAADGSDRALREHRRRQAEERLAAGPAWEDQGLVFTTEVGDRPRQDDTRRHFLNVLKADTSAANAGSG